MKRYSDLQKWFKQIASEGEQQVASEGEQQIASEGELTILQVS